MPLKANVLESALTKKGFTEDVSKKHKKYAIIKNGKKTGINTHTSHGHKEIDDSMLSVIARQMKITRKELYRFADCTLTEDEYMKILIDKKELEP